MCHSDICELFRRAVVSGPENVDNEGDSADPPAAVTPPRNGWLPLPESAVLPPQLGRVASPWLDHYIQFSRRWSPRAYDGFHEACALWILSTVAARRVLLHLGGRRYPNLYLALVARTSLYAKSTTAKIARDTLDAAGLSFFLAADDATPQAFLNRLTLRVPDGWTTLTPEAQSRELQRLAFSAQRGWWYEEFGEKVAAMMRRDGTMADFRGLLRRFDDCPPRYEYVALSRPADLIENPYLALLANITPADLRPYAGRGSSLWGDGFLARFALVAPSAEPSSRARFPEGERVIPRELAEPLRKWHTRLGIPTVDVKPVVDKEGKATGGYLAELNPVSPQTCFLGDGVVDAFNCYHDACLDLAEAGHCQELDGSYARQAEKALRIAMLLGSLENDNRIELCHWARGQEIAERWRSDLHSAHDQITESLPSADGVFEDKIIAVLGEHDQPMTAREITQHVRGLDSTRATTLLRALVASGVVQELEGNRTMRYELVDEV